MKIFYAGDIVARAGREAVIEKLPYIRNELHSDVIVLNVENAAHGFGVTPGICRNFLENGADISEKNENGRTLLMYAASSGDINIVQFL